MNLPAEGVEVDQAAREAESVAAASAGRNRVERLRAVVGPRRSLLDRSVAGVDVGAATMAVAAAGVRGALGGLLGVSVLNPAGSRGLMSSFWCAGVAVVVVVAVTGELVFPWSKRAFAWLFWRFVSWDAGVLSLVGRFRFPWVCDCGAGLACADGSDMTCGRVGLVPGRDDGEGGERVAMEEKARGCQIVYVYRYRSIKWHSLRGKSKQRAVSRFSNISALEGLAAEGLRFAVCGFFHSPPPRLVLVLPVLSCPSFLFCYRHRHRHCRRHARVCYTTDYIPYCAAGLVLFSSSPSSYCSSSSSTCRPPLRIFSASARIATMIIPIRCFSCGKASLNPSCR